MAEVFAPTDELKAVNEMLSAIGEAKVHTITESTHPDAQDALDMLRSVSRKIQSEGWLFNTLDNISLSPDVNGYINLPSNTLGADTADTDKCVDVAQRGTRLFNRAENSFVFTEALKVEIIEYLVFDDLPEEAKSYVIASAGLDFIGSKLPSEALTQFSQRRAQIARANCRRRHGSNRDANVLSDNYSVSRIAYGRRRQIR